jgi:hypothetical protein
MKNLLIALVVIVIIVSAISSCFVKVDFEVDDYTLTYSEDSDELAVDIILTNTAPSKASRFIKKFNKTKPELLLFVYTEGNSSAEMNKSLSTFEITEEGDQIKYSTVFSNVTRSDSFWDFQSFGLNFAETYVRDAQLKFSSDKLFSPYKDDIEFSIFDNSKEMLYAIVERTATGLSTDEFMAAREEALAAAAAKAEEEKIESAIGFAMAAVNEKLRNPSSARYPDDSGFVVKDLGGNTYRVSSYVSAENGFGGTSRQNFVVEITLKADGGASYSGLSIY